MFDDFETEINVEEFEDEDLTTWMGQRPDPETAEDCLAIIYDMAMNCDNSDWTDIDDYLYYIEEMGEYAELGMRLARDKYEEEE